MDSPGARNTGILRVLRPVGWRSRFPTEPASFETACSRGEAVERLRAVVSRGGAFTWKAQCLVGDVSDDGVAVWWQPGFREPPPTGGRLLAAVLLGALVWVTTLALWRGRQPLVHANVEATPRAIPVALDGGDPNEP